MLQFTIRMVSQVNNFVESSGSEYSPRDGFFLPQKPQSLMSPSRCSWDSVPLVCPLHNTRKRHRSSKSLPEPIRSYASCWKWLVSFTSTDAGSLWGMSSNTVKAVCILSKQLHWFCVFFLNANYDNVGQTSNSWDFSYEGNIISPEKKMTATVQGWCYKK